MCADWEQGEKNEQQFHRYTPRGALEKREPTKRQARYSLCKENEKQRDENGRTEAKECYGEVGQRAGQPVISARVRRRTASAEEAKGSVRKRRCGSDRLRLYAGVKHGPVQTPQNGQRRTAVKTAENGKKEEVTARAESMTGSRLDACANSTLK